MSSFRTSALAATAVAAFGLLLALPGSASAAQGEFGYSYTDPSGLPLRGMLIDPESGACVELPEVAAPEVPAADTPFNATTSTVVTFTGPDCSGDYYVLRPGGRAGSLLKLRSAMFS